MTSLYFPNPTGLHTDLYQLTMAKGYWYNGLADRKASFYLYYREPPFQHPYVITAGLEAVVEFIQNFRFSSEDIQYLAGLQNEKGGSLFETPFLNYLQHIRFSGSLEAVPEGTAVFPFNPILRLDGPIVQVQLLETGLLNLINFSSLAATKAARIVQAAQGDPVLEFGYRRAQGPDGALSASRAAYIGGCHATSNVRAGRAFGIPLRGTHAHSWVLCFEDERIAFQKYADSQPDNCVFLVDTYDTLAGLKHAIETGKMMRAQGFEMNGVRLDSGNLAHLSKMARQMLDEAGFPKVAIVASNDLDEYRIRQLKKEGAPIRVWGVGTRLATAYDQPALGGVFKLSAIKNEWGEWEPRMKLSEQAVKTSIPGRLNTYRYQSPEGIPLGDMTFDVDIGCDSSQLKLYNRAKVLNFEAKSGNPLLKPVFQEGRLVYQKPALTEIRAHSLRQQELLGQASEYPNGLEIKLAQKKEALMEYIGWRV